MWTFFLRLPSINHIYSEILLDVFKICSDVLKCSQMFSDDHRCFWIFSRYSIDVLLMFSRCSQDICRIFPGCFHDALMGVVGLVDFDEHFK